MFQWLKNNRWLLLCLSISILASVGIVTATTGKSLRQGDRGSAVIEVQEWLITLGYLEGEPTGFFGKLTTKAVKDFQRDHKLHVDGIVGSKTFRIMGEAVHDHLIRTHRVSDGETMDEIAKRFEIDPSELRNYNGLQPESDLKPGQILRIPPSTVVSRGRSAGELVLWETASQYMPIGSVFRIIDMETGLTFRAYRRGGHFHADSEPLSSADTAIMYAIYGGRWSWERRAVIVEYGNRRMAASINGMPHGRKAIAGNGFDGHFCVHFKDSRIHKTGRVDRDHQERILQAAGMMRTRLE